jgi:hypothetical protein
MEVVKTWTLFLVACFLVSVLILPLYEYKMSHDFLKIKKRFKIRVIFHLHNYPDYGILIQF